MVCAGLVLARGGGERNSTALVYKLEKRAGSDLQECRAHLGSIIGAGSGICSGEGDDFLKRSLA